VTLNKARVRLAAECVIKGSPQRPSRIIQAVVAAVAVLRQLQHVVDTASAAEESKDYFTTCLLLQFVLGYTRAIAVQSLRIPVRATIR
jgi:hypothetical protein